MNPAPCSLAITSLGLLISDGQEGPFCLDVGFIR